MTRAVYIAGPMRGIADFNFPAFFAAEIPIAEETPDALIFNPARRDVEQYGDDFAMDTSGDLAEIPEFNLREALGYDLDWICKHATEVYLLKGWSKSKGATAERATAIALGLDVTYEDPNEEQTQGEREARSEGYDYGYSDGYGDGEQDGEERGYAYGWQDAMEEANEDD